MDYFSKKCLFIIAGAFLGIFHFSAAASYYSFGRTFSDYFGDPNKINSLTENIIVPISGRVAGIDLAVNIEHTSVCDLKIYLISPSGTGACINSYDVHTFKPHQVNFYWTIFDAESLFSINSGTAPFTGLYRPNGPDSLTDFYGEQSKGTWQVKVTDWIYNDTGTFKGIRLDFDIEPQQMFIPEPSTLLLLAFSAFLKILSREQKHNLI